MFPEKYKLVKSFRSYNDSLFFHATVGLGAPVASHGSRALLPSVIVRFSGLSIISGGEPIK